MTKLKLTILIVLSNIVIASLIITKSSDEFKINARWLIFSNTTNNAKIFLQEPSQLYNQKFIFEKQKYIDLFFKKNKVDIFPLVNTSNDYVEKVRTIILSFSKNGGTGCGEYSDNLQKNISWVSKKNGCCSDHSQVFIALALKANIIAREVHHIDHTFNEFYNVDTKKWIWVDSEYCLMAKNKKGEYLSLYDIYQIAHTNEIIYWAFFGTKEHLCYSKEPEVVSDYFNKSKFKSIFMTLGNNVFEVDDYNNKLSWMSREFRQIILLFMNKQPRFLILDTGGEFSKKNSVTKLCIIQLFLLMCFLNLTVVFFARKLLFKDKKN